MAGTEGRQPPERITLLVEGEMLNPDQPESDDNHLDLSTGKLRALETAFGELARYVSGSGPGNSSQVEVPVRGG